MYCLPAICYYTDACPLDVPIPWLIQSDAQQQFDNRSPPASFVTAGKKT